MGKGIFRNQEFWIGVFTGIAIPIIFFFVFVYLNKYLTLHVFFRTGGLRLRFWVMLAIFANLLPLVVFQKREVATDRIRGLVFATVIEVCAFFVAYFSSSEFREAYLFDVIGG